MNGHIGKPIDVAELLSVVSTWVDPRPDQDGQDDGALAVAGRRASGLNS